MKFFGRQDQWWSEGEGGGSAGVGFLRKVCGKIWMEEG